MHLFVHAVIRHDSQHRCTASLCFLSIFLDFNRPKTCLIESRQDYRRTLNNPKLISFNKGLY